MQARNGEGLPTEGGPAAGASAKTPSRMPARSVPQKPVTTMRTPAATPAAPPTRPTPSRSSAAPRATAPTPTAAPPKTCAPPVRSASTVAAAAAAAPPGVDMATFNKLKEELEEVTRQLTESDNVIASLEKERDFYFSKLRTIEVICQDNESIGNVEVNRVLEVLYETEEGFAPPEDEANGGAEAEEF